MTTKEITLPELNEQKIIAKTKIVKEAVDNIEQRQQENKLN